MKNNVSKIENNNIAIYVSLLLAVILLLTDGFGNLKGIRDGLSFAFEPVSFQVNKTGSQVKEYFQTFINLGEFRSEYNDLKIASYEKEAQYTNYLILKNENEALRQQIALGNKNAEYVMANVLRDDNVDLLLLDQGSETDIKQGDVVSVGNTFVGIVSSVDLKGSAVRLPSDVVSHLEVVVLKSGQESATQMNILSSGVISGSTEGIKIENISMNSDVANGDVVYINDSKVGGFLALGYIVALSNNPASTYKTAFVSPILDYDNLMQVFVCVE